MREDQRCRLGGSTGNSRHGGRGRRTEGGEGGNLRFWPFGCPSLVLPPFSGEDWKKGPSLSESEPSSAWPVPATQSSRSRSHHSAPLPHRGPTRVPHWMTILHPPQTSHHRSDTRRHSGLTRTKPIHSTSTCTNQTRRTLISLTEDDITGEWVKSSCAVPEWRKKPLRSSERWNKRTRAKARAARQACCPVKKRRVR